MDATVSQQDGYRFLYVLPLAQQRILHVMAPSGLYLVFQITATYRAANFHWRSGDNTAVVFALLTTSQKQAYFM